MLTFEMKSIIIQVLLERGWVACNGSAVCLKTFTTAVGLKEAHAYVSKGDQFNCTLFGEYLSEGRNALGNCGVLIPLQASAESVRQLAQDFCRNVDSAVAATYAAKLHGSARS